MIDLKKMLDAGVHFGHKTSRWSPKMRPYIWGAKNKVHLIDVSKTAILLERAGKFLKEVSSTGGQVLFVGTKKPAQGIVQRCANSVQMPYVIHRWVGGTLSNYDQVKKAVTRLLHMRDVMEKSASNYKKKEISMIQKEIARLEKNVGGIIDFEYPPAAVVIVDIKKEHSAAREAARLGIPVIALVDTNTDPEGVSFIIPTNDDSPKAINFIFDYLENSIKEGLKAFEDIKVKARAEQEAKRAAAKAAADAKDKEMKEARAAAQAKQAAEKKPAAPAAAPKAKDAVKEAKAEQPKAEAKEENKAKKVEKKPAKKE
jgi:small subunit ribosomal protein S2